MSLGGAGGGAGGHELPLWSAVSLLRVPEYGIAATPATAAAAE